MLKRKLAAIFCAAFTAVSACAVYAEVGTPFVEGMAEYNKELYGEFRSGNAPAEAKKINDYSALCIYKDKVYYFVDLGGGSLRLYCSNTDSTQPRLITEFDSSLGEIDTADAVIANECIYVMANKTGENNTSSLYRVSLNDRSLKKLFSMVGFYRIIGTTNTSIYGYRVVYNDVKFYKTDLNGNNMQDIDNIDVLYELFNGYDFSELNEKTNGFTYARMCALEGKPSKASIIDAYSQESVYIGDYIMHYYKDGKIIFSKGEDMYCMDRYTNKPILLDKISYDKDTKLNFDTIFNNNLLCEESYDGKTVCYSIDLQTGKASVVKGN